MMIPLPAISLAAIALCLAACGGTSTITVPAATHSATPSATTNTSAGSSSGLSVGDACGEFHAATSMMSAAGVSNLTGMKSYGEQLVRESAQMMKEHSDPDPALASALGEAGTSNLAVAVGFLPKGLQAGLNLAAADITKVGTLCSEAGY